VRYVLAQICFHFIYLIVSTWHCERTAQMRTDSSHE